LIDIHPHYCFTLVKYDGVEKIVALTQNVEYIDLAEIAIKVKIKKKIYLKICLKNFNSFDISLLLIFLDT